MLGSWWVGQASKTWRACAAAFLFWIWPLAGVVAAVPLAPENLGQYDHAGQAVPAGAVTGSGVDNPLILKFTIRSGQPAAEPLSPQVEVRPLGEQFRGTATHAGATVVVQAYGSATVQVAVYGLTPGVGYRWQAWVSGATGDGPAVAFGGSAAQADFVVGSELHYPHLYAEDTRFCTYCHSSHASVSQMVYSGIGDPLPYGALIKAPDPTLLCLTCHDGTGSRFNVQGQFGPLATVNSFHSIKHLQARSGRELECTQCHNPHADRRPDLSVYPRLLRQIEVTGPEPVQVRDGPEFCLTCHGKADRIVGGYYAATGGDHRNPDAVHYDVYKERLLPLSGSRVTCLGCHESHAAAGSALLPRRGVAGPVGLPFTSTAPGEEDACLNCHDTRATAYGGTGENVAASFLRGEDGSTQQATARLQGRAGPSRHDVFGETGGKVECSSCHGPHTVSATRYAEGQARSAISDPDNTRLYWIASGGRQRDRVSGVPGATAGPMTEFCLRCHDGDPPRATLTWDAQAEDGVIVPYTIQFPVWSFTNAGGGWDKAVFRSSGHRAAGMECTDCHASHAADGPRLLLRGEDTASGDGACLGCHNGTGFAADVRADFLKASRHPALDLAGKHSDREDYQNLPAGDRHAECADCHDAHAAQPYAGAPRAAPWQPGPNLNVSGVAADYGVGFRGAPSGSAPALALALPARFQYEVCFKCHTSYSWNGNAFGPVVPSEYGANGGTNIGQPDKAREFNPSNPAYHPVVAQGRNGGIRTETFNAAGGFGADSRIYCTDCHGADEPDANTTSRPYGAHGSANAFLLKGPVTRIGGGGVAANEVCFRCHSYDVYYNGVLDAQGQHLSRYAGAVADPAAAQCFADAQGRVSLHCYHVRVQGNPCEACHASHGTMESSVAQSVYDSNTGWTFDVASLDPAHQADCQTPQNCWRGTKRLLAFPGRGAERGRRDRSGRVERDRRRCRRAAGQCGRRSRQQRPQPLLRPVPRGGTFWLAGVDACV